MTSEDGSRGEVVSFQKPKSLTPQFKIKSWCDPSWAVSEELGAWTSSERINTERMGGPWLSSRSRLWFGEKRRLRQGTEEHQPGSHVWKKLWTNTAQGRSASSQGRDPVGVCPLGSAPSPYPAAVQLVKYVRLSSSQTQEKRE